MLNSPYEPCIPSRGTKVPDRPEWIHEIKHDGYRLIVQLEGKRVPLWTRNGHDWSGRFPLITEAALRNRNSSFVIDGEAVLLGVDGRSDFNGRHSRKHDDEVQFYAFDILVSDGQDLRKLPLSMRKASLARLPARRVDGIFLSDFEQGEIGPDLFRHGLFVRARISHAEARRCPYWSVAATVHAWRIVHENDRARAHAEITSATLDEVSLVPTSPGNADAIARRPPPPVEFFDLAKAGVICAIRVIDVLKTMDLSWASDADHGPRLAKVRDEPAVTAAAPMIYGYIPPRPRRPPTQFAQLVAQLDPGAAP